jgi:hypothetical protein
MLKYIGNRVPEWAGSSPASFEQRRPLACGKIQQGIVYVEEQVTIGTDCRMLHVKPAFMISHVK